MHRKQKMWRIIGLVALLAIAACQKEPGNPPPAPETAVSPTDTVDLLTNDEQVTLAEERNASTDETVAELIVDEEDAVEETAVVTEPDPISEAADATIELDANGVQVGFTETGLPYRGNPNASVVIEEFSDYQ